MQANLEGQSAGTTLKTDTYHTANLTTIKLMRAERYTSADPKEQYPIPVSQTTLPFQEEQYTTTAQLASAAMNLQTTTQMTLQETEK